MDAAHTSKTFSILSALAMAVLTAGAAQGQTLQVDNSNVTVCGTQSSAVQVSASDSSAVPFNITVTAGNPYWLKISNANGVPTTSATTPAPIYFSYANSAGAPAAVTVQFASASSSTSVTVTPSSNCGPGGGTQSGPITTSQTSLAFTTANGNPTSTTLTLTNTTASQITYAIQPSSAASWLTVTPNFGQINPNNGQQVVSIQANANGLSQNQYSTNLVITNSANSQSATIPVTFSVGTGFGSGSGSLTLNPASITWNFSSGQTNPSQSVTITGSTASTFSASATPGTQLTTYLLLGQGSCGNAQGQLFDVPVSGGLTVCAIDLAGLNPGTYVGSVTVTDANGATTTLPITLTVGGTGTNNGLSVSSSSVALTGTAGTSTVAQQSVSVTSNTGGTVTVTPDGNCSSAGISAALSGNTLVAGVNGGVSLTLFGNPSGLAQNTYFCSVTVSEPNVGSVVVNVSFNLSANGGGGNVNSTIVAPSQLTFNFQAGVSSAQSAQVSLLAAGAYTAAVSYTSGQSNNTWLTVASGTSGTGPGFPFIQANPAGLSTGTYTGTVTFTTASGNGVVNVTMNVLSTTALYSFPAAINLSYSAGSANPTTSFGVATSDGTAVSGVNISTGGTSWLTAIPISQSAVQLNFTPANLGNGTYTTYVQVGSANSATPLVVPVVLTVTGSAVNGGNLTFSSAQLSGAQITLNANTPSTTLTVTAPSGTTFTAGASVNSGSVNWLTISPSGGVYSGTQSFTVSANSAGLTAGTTYNGTLSFTNGGTTQTLNVTFTPSAATGATVTATPSSLSFSYNVGDAAPAAQLVHVTNATAIVGFNVTTTTQNNGTWLSVNPTFSGTPGDVAVTVNPVNLQPGTYTGSVILTPTSGGAATTVSVTLTVQGLPTVSAVNTALNLNYILGGTIPTGTIQVTGSTPSLNFTATATTTTGPANCLTVSPASGNTGSSGSTVTVSVNPAGLTTGTCSGTVTIAGTNGSTGSTTVNVSVNVTAPLPTITAVVNAASFTSGPVAPGEIVTIGGTAMGPTPGVGLQLDTSLANVLTTIGGVQVLFSGIPAPLIFVSASQINAVVPYGIAGLLNPFVQVKYLGQTSNAFPLTSATTAPGIFTANAQGSGPGAILNGSGSLNGPGNPAPKGSTVVLYMTGEGQTTPTGKSGSVTCPANTVCNISQIPVPLLPIAISVGGVPASYSFAGEAPGLIAGVLQINVQIPANAPSGNVQLVVSIGPNSSQQNVTVSVQ